MSPFEEARVTPAAAAEAASAPGSGELARRLERLRAGLPPDEPTGVWRVVGRVREVAGRHVAVAAVGGLAALVLAAWGLLQARTWTPEAVAQVEPTWSAAASVPAPTAMPSPVLWQIHVIGAVVQPGLVELPAGSRVADALAAAGGLAPEADPGELNLAAELADGCQVVVGTTAAPRGEVRIGAGGAAAAGGAVTAGGPVNLNTATAEQLQTLPGVGPATAAAILAWRSENGRFTDVAELQEVSGIGAKTFEKLAPHVRV